MESGLSEADARLGPGGVILVVGGSGVGKDTVITGAAQLLRGSRNIVFARRSITRPAHASEDFQSLTREEFEHARDAGAFAMTWEAHGLSYGVPASVSQEIAAGRMVIVNASRRAIPLARQRYARVFVALIECSPQIRASRMAARGRESAEDIAARLSRTVDDFATCEANAIIDNSGAPEIAIHAFSTFINRIAMARAA